MNRLVICIIRLETLLSAVVDGREAELQTFGAGEAFGDDVGAVRGGAASCCRHGRGGFSCGLSTLNSQWTIVRGRKAGQGTV